MLCPCDLIAQAGIRPLVRTRLLCSRNSGYGGSTSPLFPTVTWVRERPLAPENSRNREPVEMNPGPCPSIRQPWGTFHVHSEPRDPSLSTKPPETQGKRIRCLQRTMVERNGQGINPWKDSFGTAARPERFNGSAEATERGRTPRTRVCRTGRRRRSACSPRVSDP